MRSINLAWRTSYRYGAFRYGAFRYGAFRIDRSGRHGIYVVRLRVRRFQSVHYSVLVRMLLPHGIVIMSQDVPHKDGTR